MFASPCPRRCTRRSPATCSLRRPPTATRWPKAPAWIAAAEAEHEQVLVAFYHSEHTPTMMPSVGAYQQDVQKFVKEFPQVRSTSPGTRPTAATSAHVLASPSAVGGGAVLPGADPRLQGLHGDRPRRPRRRRHRPDAPLHLRIQARDRRLAQYAEDLGPAQLLRRQPPRKLADTRAERLRRAGLADRDRRDRQVRRRLPNRHGSGLRRAAKALKYMFAAAPNSRIARLYIYHWSGGTANTRFYAGLTERPPPAARRATWSSAARCTRRNATSRSAQPLSAEPRRAPRWRRAAARAGRVARCGSRTRRRARAARRRPRSGAERVAGG